jgi:hypothetical protein
MKSSKKKLAERGFIDQKNSECFAIYSKNKLLKLLQSNCPAERTAAASMLGKNRVKAAIIPLCQALQREKRLYTKIAISEALAAIGNTALPSLIELLGKLGKNQHTKVPQTLFKKKSYPLPRDLAARTIIKIGSVALPLLETTLRTGEKTQVSEAIDAIGYIAFYTKNLHSLPALQECLKKYRSDKLINWKIIRAFQAFPTDTVIEYLKSVLKNPQQKEFQMEATRSLAQIQRQTASAGKID